MPNLDESDGTRPPEENLDPTREIPLRRRPTIGGNKPNSPTTKNPHSSVRPEPDPDDTVVITDEARKYAHDHLQGKTEDDYLALQDQIEAKITELNDKYYEYQEALEDKIRNGEEVPVDIYEGLAMSKKEGEFFLGVRKYMRDNKSVFGLTPSGHSTSTESAYTQYEEPTGKVPRTKLNNKQLLGAVLATALVGPGVFFFKTPRRAIIGRTKEIFGFDSSVPVNEDGNNSQFWTNKKKLVVGIIAGSGALFYGASLLRFVSTSENPEQSGTTEQEFNKDYEQQCQLTEDIAIDEAQQSFLATDQDPVAAIDVANQQLADYAGNCDDAVVKSAQQVAAAEIGRLSDTEAANVPEGATTTTAEVSPAEPDAEVFCKADPETGESLISYDENGVPQVDDVPYGLWEGNECDVAPGESKFVPIPSGETIRVIGR